MHIPSGSHAGNKVLQEMNSSKQILLNLDFSCRGAGLGASFGMGCGHRRQSVTVCMVHRIVMIRESEPIFWLYDIKGEDKAKPF